MKIQVENLAREQLLDIYYYNTKIRRNIWNR